MLDTTATAVCLLALLSLVLTLDPAVTVLTPAEGRYEVRSGKKVALLGTVIICGDVVLLWLSLVANSFHLFIASVIFLTISVRLLFPAIASFVAGENKRAKYKI